MGRRLGYGDAFVIADVDGAVEEVAVSGDTVAWIAEGRRRRSTPSWSAKLPQ